MSHGPGSSRHALVRVDAASSDPLDMGFGEVVGRFRDRTLSPVEYLDATLARIDVLESSLNTLLGWDRESALMEARAAEAELSAGLDRGPLHGLPITIKDVFATRGLATTAASALFEGYVPDFDAAVVERLRAAGAVILGKANMYELASGWGTTGRYPLAKNPWDPAYSPGGSSSGSASGVAVGIGVVSIATDGGGSSRVPANYCGVVGFKPTTGRVSYHGTIPEDRQRRLGEDDPISSVGIIARGVPEVAAVLGAIAGHDSRDPLSLDTPVPDYPSYLVGHAAGLRVAVLRDYFDHDASPENLRAFEVAMDVLRDAGAIVTDAGAPRELADVASTWTSIAYVELAALYGELTRTRPEAFSAELRQRIEVGGRTPAADLRTAQHARHRLRQSFRELMRTFDLIATPTAPSGPPTMDALAAAAQNLGQVGELARYTRPFNLTGMPAITLMSGLSEADMPLGFQLAGRHLEEATVLQAAHAFHARTSWNRIRPPAVRALGGVDRSRTA